MRPFTTIPAPADAEDVKWNDLTPEEQASLIRQGYEPPVGAIIRGNLDLEFDKVFKS